MTSQPRGVSPDPGKLLDERTEDAIRDVGDLAVRSGSYWMYSSATFALRARIRELIEEARHPPTASPRQIMEALGATEEEMAEAELHAWENDHG